VLQSHVRRPGYDPNGALSIFEEDRIPAQDRAGPHGAGDFPPTPWTADRIRKTQEEIQRILPDKPEYVVTTSEYRAMRDRLIGFGDAAAKTDEPGRRRIPAWRVAPGSGAPPEQDGPGQHPTIRARVVEI